MKGIVDFFIDCRAGANGVGFLSLIVWDVLGLVRSMRIDFDFVGWLVVEFLFVDLNNDWIEVLVLAATVCRSWIL